MISVPAAGPGVIFLAHTVVVDSDAVVKRQYPTPGGSYCISLEPTDSLGAARITFAGIQPGSEIHVYLPDMTEVAGTESCEANQVLEWPVYMLGSPNNTVYITIIKRGLRWMRFNYVSSVGAKEIPIFQQPDLGYSNPA